MYIREAESRFRKGLNHLAHGRARDALPFFNAAIEIQTRTDGTGFGQATYLSFQGLCLCLTRSHMHEGVNLCRRASKMDPCNPDIWWNMGRVALMVGRRGEAYRAFQEALRVHPGHPGVVRELRRMGTRSEPAVTFLRRNHPVNVALGRLRRLYRPRAA